MGFLLIANVPAKEAAEKFPLDEGHGFTGCGKTNVLYQGTTLVGP
jgi:hypothetical protein